MIINQSNYDETMDCTATGNSGHSLNQDCDTIQSTRICAKKPVLTLLILGLNKRWHFKVLD